MTARTISADDLETLARAAHADIELPGRHHSAHAPTKGTPCTH